MGRENKAVLPSTVDPTAMINLFRPLTRSEDKLRQEKRFLQSLITDNTARDLVWVRGTRRLTFQTTRDQVSDKLIRIQLLLIISIRNQPLLVGRGYSQQHGLNEACGQIGYGFHGFLS